MVAMTSSTSDVSRPLPVFFQDRLALTITTILLVAAAISWLASYYLMPLMMMNSSSGMMASGVAAIVSSLSIPSIAFFEIVWIIGMAAMMFPAMIPMVLFYNKVKTKLEASPRLAKIAGTPPFSVWISLDLRYTRDGSVCGNLRGRHNFNELQLSRRDRFHYS